MPPLDRDADVAAAGGRAAAAAGRARHQSAPRERLVRKLLRCNYKRLTPLGVDVRALTVRESATLFLL